jgi:hypothetical protein
VRRRGREKETVREEGDNEKRRERSKEKVWERQSERREKIVRERETGRREKR